MQPSLEEEAGHRNGSRHSSVDHIRSTLPRDDSLRLVQYRGFWLRDDGFSAALEIERRFVARPDDIFIASFPKSGTAWLKALLFSTIHRRRHHPRDPYHPLRSTNPHECIESLEKPFDLQQDAADLDLLPSPRTWSVHLPYSLLPESVRGSACRMVFVARDPKDTFVSLFFFLGNLKFENKKDLSLDEFFERYCSGISPYGPLWEHVLEYWNESVRRPEKVLFLTYEGMKADPIGTLRRLAEFFGCPFSEEEEREGVAAEISELCSFERLREAALKEDKEETSTNGISLRLSSTFRRGEVGDWKNHLTAEMAERLDRITQEKLQGCGLQL